MTIEPRPTSAVDIPPTKTLDRPQPKAPEQARPHVDEPPILPTWLRDRQEFAAASRHYVRRSAYRTRQRLWESLILLFKLVGWAPRGLARVTRIVGRWIYDSDSAAVRHEHATRTETAEYVRAQAVRRANLHARLLVATSGALLVGGPILIWTAPYVFSAIIGLVAGGWLIKAIPGRSLTEVVVGAALGVGLWYFLPVTLFPLVPRPPEWVFWAIGTAVVLALGWVGRPEGRALVENTRFATPSEMVKPTADMIIDALLRIGVPGMSLATAERVREEIRVIAPGVATSAHGYTCELELPPGITAEMVVANRAQLAGALRRDLGCVWPSGNENRHPGYLRLFLSHKPMNTGKQPTWPLASGKPIDVFEPIPLFTDEELRWVKLTLAGTHTAVGGASGFGKSVWLRQLACALAFDPRARLVIWDPKQSGDLDHVRRLAHAWHEGAERGEVEAMIDELHGLVREYTRRSRFLKSLPPEERSPKVTSALASKYPKDLAPYFVILDEVQEGTEYGVKGNREDKKIRDEFVGLLTRLSRVGRSAGIFLILASQKPDASVIPSSIMGNCSIRIAFKVSEQVHNDQILGTSARKNGIDATSFGSRDRGMAWIKGGDAVDAQVVRSWSEMVDVNLGVELADKAYEIRRARGLLTGQAAGEVEEIEPAADLLTDVREVLDAPGNGGKAMSLAGLCEGLEKLRPGAWGHLDVDALGAALRAAGVTPASVYCADQRRSAQGVKREWIVDRLRSEEGAPPLSVVR